MGRIQGLTGEAGEGGAVRGPLLAESRGADAAVGALPIVLAQPRAARVGWEQAARVLCSAQQNPQQTQA